MTKNEERCKSMVYDLMLNIMTNNFKGLNNQLITVGSCGNQDLNYKLAKIRSKMGEIGEEEGINYYRSWVEKDLWKRLPLKEKFSIYHYINKSWVWPTFAAIVGLSPLVFKATIHK